MKKQKNINFLILLPIAASALLVGCSSDNNNAAVSDNGFACAANAPAGLPTSAKALTTNNQLISFNPGNLSAATTTVTISNLQSGEQIVGMDFRPLDGALVALGKTGTIGRLYTINTTTGATTLLTGPNLTLAGTNYGVDFNPAANRLRIVSDAEENFRLDLTVSPYTITSDIALLPAGNIVAGAYTNNFHNSAVTSLFNIDANGTLVLQGGVDGAPSPNAGAITSVGLLGTGAISGEAGFDIDGISGVALAALNRSGATSSQLFAVDLSSGVSSCSGSIPGGVIRDIALPTPQPALAYGVSTTNQLISFVPTAAGVASATTIATISGLVSGDQIVGLDARPVDGTLYALGSLSNLYSLTTAGVATQVGTGFSTALSGTSFGFDFNPVPDRIRVVSDTDQSVRLHPAPPAPAGVFVAFDTALTPTADVSAAAYTNSFSGTLATTLLVLDTTANNLRRVGDIGGAPLSPNGGVQTTIGALGIDPDSANTGFDIVGGRGITGTGTNIGDAIAYAALTVGGAPNLYRINLATGAATQIGTMPIGGAAPVTLRGLTVRVVR